MRQLADLVLKSVQDEKNLSTPDVGEVTHGGLDIRDGPFIRAQEPSEEELAQVVRKTFGIPDAHAISMHRPGTTAVIAVIQSKRPDGLMNGIYRPLKASAEGQFTRTKPALLAVQLTDLTSPQLDELAVEPTNGLGGICNRLFANEHRGHLFGVAFLTTARPPLAYPLPQGAAFEHRGAALLFRRTGHPSSNDPRLKRLFFSDLIPTRA
jgi:hypothetical protein